MAVQNSFSASTQYCLNPVVVTNEEESLFPSLVGKEVSL